MIIPTIVKMNNLPSSIFQVNLIILFNYILGSKVYKGNYTGKKSIPKLIYKYHKTFNLKELLNIIAPISYNTNDLIIFVM